MRIAIIAMAILAMPVPALAGKLADGFRGVPFGPDSVIAAAPLPECHTSTEEGVKWACNTTIGDHSVQVAYMADEGLFYAVMLLGEGYAVAEGLMRIFRSAYGPGSLTKSYNTESEPLADRIWRDGPVWASWEYNQFSDGSHLIIVHDKYHNQMKAAKVAKSKNAIGDL